MTRASAAAELMEGAHTLGVALTAEQAERLLDYLDRLYLWNRSARLTSVAAEDAPRLHLLDSLSLFPLLDGARTVADLGCGAGLPGIPLALVEARTAFTLVESNRRKCNFVRESVRALGLDNVRVVEGDVTKLAASGERFAAVVGRAFRPPLEFVRLAARLIEDGGSIVVMGGRLSDGTVEAAAAAVPGLRLLDDRRFTLPGGSERRRIVVLGCHGLGL